MGYFANFMVYTFAMVGIIAVALLVFKHSNSFGGGCKSKYMKVLDSLSLAPRKTLHIVSTGSEKFLIACDVDKTTLISKLDDKKVEMQTAELTFKETMEALPKSKYMDRSNIGIRSSILSEKTGSSSVMKNLALRMKE